MAKTIEKEKSLETECSIAKSTDLDDIVDVILSDYDGNTLAFFESIQARTAKPPPVDVLQAALALKFAKVS